MKISSGRLHLSNYSLQKTKSFRKKSTGDLTTIDNNNKNSKCSRIFLVEAPCAMSPPQLPLSAKPRHLFLFSDLLLVAKPRSGGTFKLKVNQFRPCGRDINGSCASCRKV